jgi:hypothetical protein
MPRLQGPRCEDPSSSGKTQWANTKTSMATPLIGPPMEPAPKKSNAVAGAHPATARPYTASGAHPQLVLTPCQAPTHPQLVLGHGSQRAKSHHGRAPSAAVGTATPHLRPAVVCFPPPATAVVYFHPPATPPSSIFPHLRPAAADDVVRRRPGRMDQLQVVVVAS